jgi:cysteinyl-tRNA synthetase
MSEAVLGLPIDIHGGGHDLIFPHHTNEIAQSCAAHRAEDPRAYARYWMHNGFLDFSGEKMSKSLGNVVLVHDLLESYPGEVIRWALLSAHYRSPLDWSPELLEQSRKALDRLYGRMQRADAQTREGGEGVLEALADDLNTPQALSVLFELDGASLRAAGAVLGVLQLDPAAWFEGRADATLKAEVERLIAERDAARQARDWPEADRIRDRLTALGVVVMDGPTGATWRMKD